MLADADRREPSNWRREHVGRLLAAFRPGRKELDSDDFEQLAGTTSVRLLRIMHIENADWPCHLLGTSPFIQTDRTPAAWRSQYLNWREDLLAILRIRRRRDSAHRLQVQPSGSQRAISGQISSTSSPSLPHQMALPSHEKRQRESTSQEDRPTRPPKKTKRAIVESDSDDNRGDVDEDALARDALPSTSRRNRTHTSLPNGQSLMTPTSLSSPTTTLPPEVPAGLVSVARPSNLGDCVLVPASPKDSSELFAAMVIWWAQAVLVTELGAEDAPVATTIWEEFARVSRPSHPWSLGVQCNADDEMLYDTRHFCLASAISGRGVVQLRFTPFTGGRGRSLSRCGRESHLHLEGCARKPSEPCHM